MPPSDDVERQYIREFRYDDDQQRYLERNSASEATGTLAQYDVVPGTQVWHDFVGASMWNDYAAEESSGSAAVAPLVEYTHGMGLVAQQPVGGAIRYAHADMLGTTRYMTDSSGDPAGGMQYSAFGELLGPAEFGATTYASRYGYVGSYGYQNDALADAANDIGLLYVGARHYDPSIGRFVMRDPIGVFGGINAYVYCLNNSTNSVDPTGLATLIELILGQEVGEYLEATAAVAARETGARLIVVIGTIEGAFLRYGTRMNEIILEIEEGSQSYQSTSILVRDGMYKIITQSGIPQWVCTIVGPILE